MLFGAFWLAVFFGWYNQERKYSNRKGLYQLSFPQMVQSVRLDLHLQRVLAVFRFPRWYNLNILIALVRLVLAVFRFPRWYNTVT